MALSQTSKQFENVWKEQLFALLSVDVKESCVTDDGPLQRVKYPARCRHCHKMVLWAVNEKEFLWQHDKVRGWPVGTFWVAADVLCRITTFHIEEPRSPHDDGTCEHVPDVRR